jgi:hypothetical protein
MRLNHLDVQVSDVDVGREFFERFFGLRCRDQRQKQIAIFESAPDSSSRTVICSMVRRRRIRQISI